MEYLKGTLYDALGGERGIETIVEQFYDRVSEHPELIPLFPDDLTDTRRKQKQFLTQFCGGPALFTREHGHPRLRARHLPFPITPVRAEAWLDCMGRALQACELENDKAVQELYQRLTLTAQHMINSQV